MGQGYRQGEAAAAYLPWLRAKYLAGGTERDELVRLARLILAGREVWLGCWCDPLPCHAQHVRAAVIGVARSLS